jgi:hypothetical protein
VCFSPCVRLFPPSTYDLTLLERNSIPRDISPSYVAGMVPCVSNPRISKIESFILPQVTGCFNRHFFLSKRLQFKQAIQGSIASLWVLMGHTYHSCFLHGLSVFSLRLLFLLSCTPICLLQHRLRCSPPPLLHRLPPHLSVLSLRHFGSGSG